MALSENSLMSRWFELNLNIGNLLSPSMPESTAWM
jgi:hypothetical protein